MSSHVFDVDDAVRYGVNAAIVLDHLRRWIAHNEFNGKNKKDGRTWTYNSVKAWAGVVPYLTAKQVRKAIDDLVAAGVLVKGNFNANRYDRTLWYALGDGISPTRQIEPEPLPSGANRDAPEGKSLVHGDTKEVPSIAPQEDELSLEAGRFVTWFLELLKKTGAPEQRLTPKNLELWKKTYVFLRRDDKKPKGEIVRVCEWARNDSFWKTNFYAPTKLRDRKDGVSRYDLFLQRLQNGNPTSRPNTSRSLGEHSNLSELAAYEARLAANS